jgi:hypothetical protein
VVIVSLLVMVFTVAYFIISIMDGAPAVIVGVEYYYLKVRGGESRGMNWLGARRFVEL